MGTSGPPPKPVQSTPSNWVMSNSPESCLMLQLLTVSRSVWTKSLTKLHSWSELNPFSRTSAGARGGVKSGTSNHSQPGGYHSKFWQHWGQPSWNHVRPTQHPNKNRWINIPTKTTVLLSHVFTTGTLGLDSQPYSDGSPYPWLLPWAERSSCSDMNYQLSFFWVTDLHIIITAQVYPTCIVKYPMTDHSSAIN